MVNREVPVETRIDLNKYYASALGRAMLGLQKEVDRSGLEQSLLHLLELRASQVNGCAFCIDMHWKDARAAGETEQRLYGLDAWRESPYYTPRERAALAWTEAVTRISETQAPDEVYQELKGQFKEEEMVALTFALVAINGWNRLCIGFRVPAGTYEPRKLVNA
jgi:AhpD family alkylhydroperoxidase